MRKRQVARVETARATVALGRVIDETRQLFHRLRDAAEQLHEANRLTAGERAVLVELAEQGPRTVPYMARARPVSRQHIQTLVNLLLKRSLAELAENPNHQRSKFVQLTGKGRALAKTVRAWEVKVLAQLSREFDPEELEQTAKILSRVGDLFEGQRFSTERKKGASRHAS